MGVGALAYTMVAERDDHKVTKERTSALILLANARVWASEGWQVVITDADGKQHLLSRKAFLKESTDGGFTWQNLTAGFVSAKALMRKCDS